MNWGDQTNPLLLIHPLVPVSIPVRSLLRLTPIQEDKVIQKLEKGNKSLMTRAAVNFQSRERVNVKVKYMGRMAQT